MRRGFSHMCGKQVSHTVAYTQGDIYREAGRHIGRVIPPTKGGREAYREVYLPY